MNQSPRRRIGLLLILALVLGGIAYGVYSAMAPLTGDSGSASQGKSKGPSVPVQVATAIRLDVPVYLNGLGTVTASNTATVKSRVDGQLMKLHFTEGKTVKAGQLLAELDPRPFQVSLSQAEGLLAHDQASLANAIVDLKRFQTLLSQESIARQQVDTQAALVRQLEGSLKTDRAQVDAARLQLDYSRITAPIGGRVGLKQVDLGNQVKSGDTNGLVVITQVQPINVVFTLPEAQLASVLAPQHSGETLAVEAWDREMKQTLARGKLLALDNQIDTTTGTVKLKAEFSNEDDTLFPNQFVNARLQVGTLRQAVVVPVGAVQTGKQGSFVWVLGANDRVSQRTVSTGPNDGERVVVSTGVAAGERLVTDGIDRLKPGMKVQVVEPGKPGGRQGHANGQPPSGGKHRQQKP